MKRRIPTLVLLALSWSLPVRAQTKVELEIAPFAGMTFYLNGLPARFALQRGEADPLIVEDGRYDDGVTLGVHGGVRLGDRIAVEGMFSWVPTRLHAKAGLPGEMDVNGFMYGGSLTYILPFSWDIEPFLGVGIGAETYDYEATGVEIDTELMGNVYAGFHYPLRSHLGLRFELRDCVTWFDSRIPGAENQAQNDLMATVGLAVRVPLFGR